MNSAIEHCITWLHGYTQGPKNLRQAVECMRAILESIQVKGLPEDLQDEHRDISEYCAWSNTREHLNDTETLGFAKRLLALEMNARAWDAKE